MTTTQKNTPNTWPNSASNACIQSTICLLPKTMEQITNLLILLAQKKKGFGWLCCYLHCINLQSTCTLYCSLIFNDIFAQVRTLSNQIKINPIDLGEICQIHG